MKLYRNFSSQEEIDREYDTEASVPDFGRYAAFFVGESERARRDLAPVPDVRFGPTRDETMDVFPAASPGAPVLVFVHGGYWRILSAKEFSLVARGPVAHGVTVAVTNYSLCPKVGIPEITRQSRAAIAFLAREARRFNGDPDRIVVAGHSAGGQQVGMLLSTDWPGEYDLPPTVVRGGLAISGLFDLRPFAYSWLQPKLLLDQRTVERESPLFNIPRRAAPLLATVGGDESSEFHRQTRDYLAAWRAAGLQGAAFDQPGRNHFTAIEGFVDPDSELTRRTVAFIDEAAPGQRSAAGVPSGGAAAERPVQRPTQSPGGVPTQPEAAFPTFGQRGARLSFERGR